MANPVDWDAIMARYERVKEGMSERKTFGFGFPIAEGAGDDIAFEDMSGVELEECLGQLDNEIEVLREDKTNLRRTLRDMEFLIAWKRTPRYIKLKLRVCRRFLHLSARMAGISLDGLV